MKILMLGMNDPAGMMIAFAQAINRYTEHTARVISYRTMYQQDYAYDLEVPRLKDDWGEIEHLLKTADIFHFHMLLDESYQLGPFHLKDFVGNKPCLYHHHGTYDHQCFLGQVERYQAHYKKTGKRVLVSTPDLLEQLPMATWQPNIVPIYDHGFLPRENHFNDSVPFRAVQAPTRPWHKHTDQFVQVCEELAIERDDFTFEILSGMSFRECLGEKRSAHACFDHMNGWFGIASLESLAQGIPTLAGLSDSVVRCISEFTGIEGHPWRVVKSSQELKNELSSLAQDRGRALELGRQGRSFMEQYWNEKAVITPLLNTYSSLS